MPVLTLAFKLLQYMQSAEFNYSKDPVQGKDQGPTVLS